MLQRPPQPADVDPVRRRHAAVEADVDPRGDGLGAHQRASSRHPVALGLRLLEFEPEPRPGAIRGEHATAGLERPVEQDPLDPLVVVEVLDVDHALHRAAGVRGDRRGAVRGERQVARLAQAIDPQEVRDPAAARHVSLEDVNGAGLEHPLVVGKVPAVLARRDGQPGRSAPPDLGQPGKILRTDRLLEVGDALVAEGLPPQQGLRRRVGAVAVDHQLDLRPGDLPHELDATGVGELVAAHLDLHAAQAGVRPLADLIAQLSLAVVAEAARSVDRNAVVKSREGVGEAHVEQLGLQVPERDVDGRDRHRGDARVPELARLHLHLRPATLGHQSVGSLEDVAQLGLDHLGGGRVAVGVAEAGPPVGVNLCDDDARRAPFERSVGLDVGRGGDLVRAGLNGLDPGLLEGGSGDAHRVTNSSSLPLIDSLMIRPACGSPGSAFASFCACSKRMCGGSGGTSGSVIAS